MTPQATGIVQRRRAFRELHRTGCFVMPNPWDRGSARYLQGLGFKALGTTSAGAAWSLARADGTLSLDDALDHLRDIVQATAIPVDADFQSGFAQSAAGIADNIRKAVDTGVAGISLEDGSGIASNPVRDLGSSVARLQVARAVLDEYGPDAPLLVGRAGNFRVGRPDLEDIILRLQAYAGAGADVLCAPGVSTREEIAALVDAVHPTPLDVLVRSDTALTFDDIASLGVRRISVGAALARSAWGGFMRAAQSIAEDGRFDFGRPASGKELNSFFKLGTETLSTVNAHILGRVEFRLGEGPLLEIRRGLVEITFSPGDAVFAWSEGSSREEAAMPFANFCRYVSDGAIVLVES
ncbi:isocitrate lyase/phosphoenolpyruvate mutase family protein [Ramlibacter sp. CrO1]|uniref:Isocitrate lyase/phosphoenolpyruvate mutase family protein n=1 Tax=Ramlibacter algicola TaxID=2795217 RepID=A0A934URE2_9BURK|nr:isocitrate lyase/phosphoenolpyruvate mutase family protein [Ramlibacter algicola]